MLPMQVPRSSLYRDENKSQSLGVGDIFMRFYDSYAFTTMSAKNALGCIYYILKLTVHKSHKVFSQRTK